MKRVIIFLTILLIFFCSKKTTNPPTTPPSAPQISLNKTTIEFTAAYDTKNPPPETLHIGVKNIDSLYWFAMRSHPERIALSSYSGMAPCDMRIHVSIFFPNGDPLWAGTHTGGTISIYSDTAENSPQEITVTLNLLPVFTSMEKYKVQIGDSNFFKVYSDSTMLKYGGSKKIKGIDYLYLFTNDSIEYYYLDDAYCGFCHPRYDTIMFDSCFPPVPESVAFQSTYATNRTVKFKYEYLTYTFSTFFYIEDTNTTISVLDVNFDDAVRLRNNYRLLAPFIYKHYSITEIFAPAIGLVQSSAVSGLSYYARFVRGYINGHSFGEQSPCSNKEITDDLLTILRRGTMMNPKNTGS